MAAKIVEVTAQDIEALARIVSAEAKSLVDTGYSEKQAYATIIDTIIMVHYPMLTMITTTGVVSPAAAVAA